MSSVLIFYVYLASLCVCILGITDQILQNIQQDYQLEGFVDTGYPKPAYGGARRETATIKREYLPPGYHGPTVNIFKGIRVSTREHPYIASIRRMYAHYSTGTLITKNLVISVAHPFVNVNPSELGVVVGQNYFDRGTFMATVVILITHEDFDPYTLASDIVLLRLYEDIIYRAAVKPIGLVSPRELLDGKTAFVTGWGRCDRSGKELCLWRSSIYNPHEKMDPMLRSVSFKINLPNFYCEGYKHHDVHLRLGMMCVGPAREENPVAPCLAVPGAPLVVKSRLAGVLSWGFGCGYSFDLPLIYTNIQFYQRWLLHNIPILRGINSKNLTEIFDATRAYVLTQWLSQTRIVKPSRKEYALKELQALKVDYKLATLRGTVYDIRDFINNGMFHNDKVNMYDALKYRDSNMNNHYLKNKVETAPFLSNLEVFNNTDAVIFFKNDNVPLNNYSEEFTDGFNSFISTTSSDGTVSLDMYD